MFLLRKWLAKIPVIAILVAVGILINWTHYFLSYQDLCGRDKVDCNFYIIKMENLLAPKIQQLLTLLPASLVMTAIIIFEQFLTLEEFERRGKRFGGGGDLG